ALFLASFDDEPVGVPADPSLPAAILRVHSPEGPPQDIPLMVGEHTVGRGEDVTIKLRHNSVSRRHLHLRIEEGRIVATDLGSSTGTFIDSVRIRRPTPVVFGASIMLGGQRVELCRAAAPPAMPRPTQQWRMPTGPVVFGEAPKLAGRTAHPGP